MFAGTYWLSGRWLMLVGVPYNTKRSRIARSVLGVAVVVLCGIWRVVVIVVMHVIAFSLLCEIAAVIARRIGKRFKGKRVYSVCRVIYRSAAVPLLLTAALMLYGTVNMWHIVRNDYTVTSAKLADEYNQGRPIKVVANLPYYITTPIIMGLFESHVPIDSITIMVQKEVADRMQVGPGTKDYGALSLAVQYYAKPEIIANVPPNCFMPRPNVGSAVIRLTRHETVPVQVEDEKLMFRLIRASFNQRRKTLANGLNNSPEIHLSKEVIQESIEELGVPVTIRGEALTLEQFAALSNIIGRRMKQQA